MLHRRTSSPPSLLAPFILALSIVALAACGDDASAASAAERVAVSGGAPAEAAFALDRELRIRESALRRLVDEIHAGDELEPVGDLATFELAAGASHEVRVEVASSEECVWVGIAAARPVRRYGYVVHAPGTPEPVRRGQGSRAEDHRLVSNDFRICPGSAEPSLEGTWRVTVASEDGEGWVGVRRWRVPYRAEGVKPADQQAQPASCGAPEPAAAEAAPPAPAATEPGATAAN